MAIITDGDYLYRDEYLLEFCGESELFRRAEYVIEHPLYRYRSNLAWAIDEIRNSHVYIDEAANQNYSDYRPRDLYGEYSLVVKASQWSHEHEWRLICKTREKYIKIPCLSAVFWGARFDYNRFDEVVSAIKDSGTRIRLYSCITDQKRYAFKFKEIKKF